jgi:hypothetical protein
MARPTIKSQAKVPEKKYIKRGAPFKIIENMSKGELPIKAICTSTTEIALIKIWRYTADTVALAVILAVHRWREDH